MEAAARCRRAMARGGAVSWRGKGESVRDATKVSLGGLWGSSPVQPLRPPYTHIHADVRTPTGRGEAARKPNNSLFTQSGVRPPLERPGRGCETSVARPLSTVCPCRNLAISLAQLCAPLLKIGHTQRRRRKLALHPWCQGYGGEALREGRSRRGHIARKRKVEGLGGGSPKPEGEAQPTKRGKAPSLARAPLPSGFTPMSDASSSPRPSEVGSINSSWCRVGSPDPRPPAPAAPPPAPPIPPPPHVRTPFGWRTDRAQRRSRAGSGMGGRGREGKSEGEPVSHRARGRNPTSTLRAAWSRRRRGRGRALRLRCRPSHLLILLPPHTHGRRVGGAAVVAEKEKIYYSSRGSSSIRRRVGGGCWAAGRGEASPAAGIAAAAAKVACVPAVGAAASAT
jgi:hypothetical protein